MPVSPIGRIDPRWALPTLDEVEAGLVVLDALGHIQIWNRWLERRSGRSAEQVIGRSLAEAFGIPLERRFAYMLKQALEHGLPVLLSHGLHPSPLPLFVEGQQGERIKQQVTLKPIFVDARPCGCLIQISDVTEIVRRETLLKTQANSLAERLQRLSETQAELQYSETRFRQLASKAPVGMFETDATGHVVFANERWCRFIARPLSELRARPFFEPLAGEQRAQLAAAWEKSRVVDAPCNIDCRLGDPAQRACWLRIELTPIHAPGATTSGYIGTAVDLTDEREMTLRYAYSATHDSLTGLHNRAHLETLLAHAVTGATAGTGPLSLLFLDLNGFKPINDAYGHETGDRVLRVVARRLRRELREDDAIGRFGGDEFVVILSDYSCRADIDGLCARLREAVTKPINVGTQLVSVGCALGRADYPVDGADATALLQRADANMYEDKARAKRDR